MSNITICKTDECTGCGACLQICPKGCIQMNASDEGYFYPKIDSESCIECKKCIRTCPNNRTLKKNQSRFFMGWHKDMNVLRKSSSGGAFTAISSIAFSKGGVVYGAAYNEKSGEISHLRLEKERDLDKVRLSKYYQGRSDNVYPKVKQDLRAGRYVLFSGTACQVAGLYSYLDKEYDNLITVDVLCHGIASKKIVNAYIKSKEKQYKKKICKYIFRLKPKDSDWMSGGVQE